MDDLISRIDAVLDEPDDEGTDDWQYPWTDSMRWAPPGVELPEGCWEDEPEGSWTLVGNTTLIAKFM